MSLYEPQFPLESRVKDTNEIKLAPAVLAHERTYYARSTLEVLALHEAPSWVSSPYALHVDEVAVLALALPGLADARHELLGVAGHLADVADVRDRPLALLALHGDGDVEDGLRVLRLLGLDRLLLALLLRHRQRRRLLACEAEQRASAPEEERERLEVLRRLRVGAELVPALVPERVDARLQQGPEPDGALLRPAPEPQPVVV